MREASWAECLESNTCIPISPDRGKASSVLGLAKERLKYLRTLAVDDKSASFIFEGYYASLLEYAHALVLEDGFKVSNHLCLGFYLRDVLKRPDLFRIFDDCRMKRNSLIYYGKRLDIQSVKGTMGHMDVFLKELDAILRKNKEGNH